METRSAKRLIASDGDESEGTMNQSERDWGGPYLQAAFFCERLLQETDGVPSAIRIVDHVTAQAAGPVSPGSPHVPVSLTFVLLFKTGKARGYRELTIAMVPPGGSSSLAPGDEYSQRILFEGPDDRGDTIIMPITMIPISMTLEAAGIYWFNVSIDQRFMTRVPLRVEIPKQTPGLVPR
jgi:hypothetical protein